MASDLFAFKTDNTVSLELDKEKEDRTSSIPVNDKKDLQDNTDSSPANPTAANEDLDGNTDPLTEITIDKKGILREYIITDEELTETARKLWKSKDLISTYAEKNLQSIYNLILELD